MSSLAKSPLAPVLGQHVPLRGPARLLFRSYARTRCQPGVSVRRLTTRTGDQFEADLSSFLEWQLWAFGSFEEHFADLFGRLVRPGDRCVDVGANIGVHTVRLAKLVGDRGAVVAIEPDAELAVRTRRNLAINNLSNTRVIVAAATDHAADSLRLYRPGRADTNRARASLLEHDYLTGTSTSVPGVTVDDVGARPVRLIKIDVEGHESAVVAGAAATIEQDRPAVVFEYAPELLASRAQSPFGWFAGHGYEMFRIRQARNGLTGRGHLVLDRLPAQPEIGGDILAAPPEMASLVRDRVR
ncbi:MAG TPA: FkbM family methyltransferase [Streptosporangiaceae bacterium]|jgi:FkbM family methyltransferase